MTHNQIEYGRLKEDTRHNKVTESETSRHNTVVEVETNRHNLVMEDQGQQVINENIRHNQAAEAETNRHNVATENENVRHNTEQESIGYVSAAASMIGANAAASQAKTADWNARANYVVNSRNATSNERNASSNATNAEANKRNASTNAFDAVTRRKSQEQDAPVKKSQAAKNWSDALTGGYRNVMSGASDIINSVTNVLGTGLKSLGGLLK